MVLNASFYNISVTSVVSFIGKGNKYTKVKTYDLAKATNKLIIYIFIEYTSSWTPNFSDDKHLTV